jgi:hypothetical protein
MHEAGVGSILQQSSHEIGQQVFVCTDRCIDADGVGRAVIERLAHAVQPLHLEVASRALQHEGEAVRVVRGKGGIDRITTFEHSASAGQPTHIRRRFAGEHRIVGVPLHLCQLDLAVPVGALHQPNRDTVICSAAERSHPIDQRQRTPLISLHGETQPIPACKDGVRQHVSDDIQTDLQPIRLLRIDGEADRGVLRCACQAAQRADQRRDAAMRLQWFIARMQCRQLD